MCRFSMCTVQKYMYTASRYTYTFQIDVRRPDLFLIVLPLVLFNRLSTFYQTLSDFFKKLWQTTSDARCELKQIQAFLKCLKCRSCEFEAVTSCPRIDLRLEVATGTSQRIKRPHWESRYYLTLGSLIRDNARFRQNRESLRATAQPVTTIWSILDKKLLWSGFTWRGKNAKGR